jgi:hypothetical protein
MILDAHVHVRMKSEPLSPNLHSYLKGAWPEEEAPTAFGTREDLYRGMREFGIGIAVLMPVAISPDPSAAAKLNDFFGALADRKRLYAFASVNPLHSDAMDELDRAVQRWRMKGLKLHPNLQKFRLSDNRLWRVLETVKDLSIPVMVHSGFSPRIQETYFHPEEADDMVSSFPDVTFIFAHMGRMEKEEDFPTVSMAPNVYFDTSLSPTSVIEEYIKSFGTERLLYGSNFKYNRYPAHELAKVQELKISSEERADILGRTASRLMGIPYKRKRKEGLLGRLPFFG